MIWAFPFVWMAGCGAPSPEATRHHSGPPAADSGEMSAPVDSSPPRVALFEPNDGDVVEDYFRIDAEASDDRAVATLDLLVDGQVILTSASSRVETVRSTGGLGNGDHTVSAQATDSAGNTRTATVTISVQNLGDADDDEYTAVSAGGNDCDDSDPAIHPHANEIIGDGIDQDCDGVDQCWVDDDNDNYGTDRTWPGSSLDCVTGTGAPVSGDCDDADPNANPGEAEIVGDEVDEDCDGAKDTVLDLGAVGVEFVGEAAADHAGSGVAGLGDVNGDGYADVIVGAYGSDRGGSEAGVAYVILGGRAHTSGDLGLADVILTGEGAADGIGCAVAKAGDVDGDGYDDIVLAGADTTDAGAYAAAWLVLGGSAPTSRGLGAADAVYTGLLSDAAGAGDVDGDGFADLVLGAGANDDAGEDAGAAFLVLGGGTPESGSIASLSVEFTGEARGEMAGRTVAAAGDVDGDGFDDVLVGSDRYPGFGVVYLLRGEAAPISRSLGDADAAYSGAAEEQLPGTDAGVGDVNGDGYADLLFGRPVDSAAGSSTGAVFLVLGTASLASGDLASADAVFTGVTADCYAGDGVAGAGDVDADGFADLLIGSTCGAYMIRGRATPASYDLTRADSDYAASGEAGSTVSGAGDTNGDGLDDIIIGAPYSDDAASWAGSAFLVVE